MVGLVDSSQSNELHNSQVNQGIKKLVKKALSLFSVNIKGLEFQQMGFLKCYCFAHLNQILAQICHPRPFENFVILQKKKWNFSRFFYYKDKLIKHANFILISSKLTSEICQKIENLDGKKPKNCLKKIFILPFFFPS